MQGGQGLLVPYKQSWTGACMAYPFTDCIALYIPQCMALLDGTTLWMYICLEVSKSLPSICFVSCMTEHAWDGSDHLGMFDGLDRGLTALPLVTIMHQSH